MGCLFDYFRRGGRGVLRARWPRIRIQTELEPSRWPHAAPVDHRGLDVAVACCGTPPHRSFLETLRDSNICEIQWPHCKPDGEGATRTARPPSPPPETFLSDRPEGLLLAGMYSRPRQGSRLRRIISLSHFCGHASRIDMMTP